MVVRAVELWLTMHTLDWQRCFRSAIACKCHALSWVCRESFVSHLWTRPPMILSLSMFFHCSFIFFSFLILSVWILVRKRVDCRGDSFDVCFLPRRPEDITGEACLQIITACWEAAYRTNDFVPPLCHAHDNHFTQVQLTEIWLGIRD